jgi:hypothetical protein
MVPLRALPGINICATRYHTTEYATRDNRGTESAFSVASESEQQ